MIDARVDDRTIDDVARAMTSAAPSADFAARVTAALPPRPATAAWYPWRLTVAGLGVAAATMVLLSSRVTVSIPTVEPGPLAAAPVVATAIPSSAVPGESLTPVRTPAAGRAARRVVEPTIYRLPALSRPATLDVAPIQPENVSIGLLEVKPMATEPLAIPRLDPRGGSR
jgi:hypothetical protein